MGGCVCGGGGGEGGGDWFTIECGMNCGCVRM